jgi:hypothetical protein
MGRTNRVIFEGTLYEVVPRAREGLPLPPTEVTNLLLTGILARVQRDNKVTLCNFVEMNNHAHQHCIASDPALQVKFYMEYQKKVTDTVRKLTKRRWLHLWEGRPSVAYMAELQDAINRLVYIFLNPVRAGLVESIDDYPGLSSWKAFLTCEPSVDAEVIVRARWIPASRVPALPSGNRLSPTNDRLMAQGMRDSPYAVSHDLVIKPLAWLKIFGVTEPREIEAIRQRVVSQVRENEAVTAQERRNSGRGTMGSQRLRQQEYLRPHVPKRKDRRIYLICGNHNLRPQIIHMIQSVLEKCRQCYQALKDGRYDEWPPGTFVPWLPPRLCRSAMVRAWT